MGLNARGALLGGVLVAAVALLSSCGGGGGGGSTAGGSPDAGNPSPTGLVPAAPPVGAVLQADATALLPLRTGAVWHYRGRRDDRITDAVTLQLTAAGSEFRAERDDGRDRESLTYAVQAGNVVAREDLVTGTPNPTTVQYTVLRSPVRQGDQITLIDLVGIAAGEDIDGDRVNDTADMAVYSRVVGSESVELPELQRTLNAIRVDTTVHVRFNKSTDGRPMPVATTVQSEWYAAGIGVVRTTTTALTIDGSIGPVESDERLVYWDGGNAGIGALPAERVVHESAPYGWRPAGSAVRIGDRAVVDARLPTDRTDALRLTVLDKSGAMLATHLVAEPGSERPRPALQVLGDTLGVVTVDAGYSGRLRLRRFDRDLAPVGPADGVVLVPSREGGMAVTSDGQTLWVAWAEEPTWGDKQLWLRRYAADGQPMGDAVRLESGRADLHGVRLGAEGGRVLAVWWVAPSGPREMRYALVKDGAPPLMRTLMASNDYALQQSLPRPVVTARGQWFTWTGPLGSGESYNTDGLLRGVAVGDDARVQRTSAEPSLDSEKLVDAGGAALQAVSFVDTTSTAAVAVDGSDLIAGVVRKTRLYANDSFDYEVLQVNRWPLDTGATARESRSLRLTRVGWSQAQLGGVDFVLPFDDRLLLLGHLSDTMTRSVMFRR